MLSVLAWPIDANRNPYTALLYKNIGPGISVDPWPGHLFTKYSVWHMHWPEALLNIRNPFHAATKVSGLFAALQYMRLRGTKVIWTMHNFRSHDALHPALERRFWRHFIPRVDGVVSLSPVGLSLALQRFPALHDLPAAVIPHGHYRNEYPAYSGDARQSLGIPASAKVFLFFGSVRAYKNVARLVRTFREIPGHDLLLYVVGEPISNALANQIASEAALDPRIKLVFQFVNSSEVALYLGAADAVVLPYREILNSGSALLALSLNRPVIAPDLGAIRELQSDFGENWVHTYHGELDCQVLKRALHWAIQQRPPVCPMPPKFEWRNIGRATARFYQTVIARHSVRHSVVAIERFENE